MEIKTKFNLGQEVYYVGEFTNRDFETAYEPVPAIVERIIYIMTTGIIDEIYYTLDYSDYIEDEVFATREEAEETAKELNEREKENKL